MLYEAEYEFCQWCCSRLGVSSEDNCDRRGRKFCNNCGYCRKRYLEERNGIWSPEEKICAFCHVKKTYINWTIGDNSFCNGVCVDLFNEMQVNPKLLELKVREDQLRADLEDVKKSINEIAVHLINPEIPNSNYFSIYKPDE